MARILVAALFALLCAPFALAQTHHTSLVVAFGKVRGADGRMHSIKGLVLPAKVTRIHAGPAGKTNPFTIPPPRLATVYMCDSGTYAVQPPEFEDPSSLDDVMMAGGANVPWREMALGVQVDVNRTYLIRWRCYTTYDNAAVHNTSAFGGEVADFGVIVPFWDQLAQVGQWKVELDISAAGAVSPQNQIYLAQQFRTPQPDGEGPFDTAMKNIYDQGAPPTTGSSENGFYYDFDDLNGIYSNDEYEVFSTTPPPFANHLRWIDAGGSGAMHSPGSIQTVMGTYSSGDLFSVLQDDGTYYIARDTAQVQIEVQGQANQATVQTLRFTIDGAVVGGVGTIRVELFNWQTNQYDVLATEGAAVGGDTTISVFPQNNPSKYVNAAAGAQHRRMKSRIMFTRANRVTRNMDAKLDYAAWTVTYP